MEAGRGEERFLSPQSRSFRRSESGRKSRLAPLEMTMPSGRALRRDGDEAEGTAGTTDALEGRAPVADGGPVC